MILKSNFIKQNERIDGAFDCGIEINQPHISISFHVYKVYDFYDCGINLEGKADIFNGMCHFYIDNNLENGLYYFTEISSNELGIKTAANNQKEYFFVGDSIVNDPKELYETVLDFRNKMFSFPKNEISDETKSFDVHLFCKNLLIANSMVYNDVSVEPFNELPYTSEVKLINDYLIQQNIPISVKDTFRVKPPVAVFTIVNIFAKNYDKAIDYALEVANKLNGVYSVLLQSNGTFFAAVCTCDAEKQSRVVMLEKQYRGNLFLANENPFVIKHYYDFLKNDTTHLMSNIRLFNEALKENDRFMHYYRYWNILEDLDRENNKSRVKIKKYDCVDYLKDFLKLLFVNEADGEIISLKLTLEDFLRICYQRRCCCAHRGTCYPEDRITYCTTGKTQKEIAQKNLCMRNMDEYGDWFSDPILRELHFLTQKILLRMLEKAAGKPIKDRNFLNFLIERENHDQL